MRFAWVTENWILRSSATFLEEKFGDFSGRVVDTNILLEYFFWRDMGVMFGGSGTDIEIENEGSIPYRIGYGQSGAIIALTYGHR